MLIPAIDLMGGRVVQLRQGEELAIATDDVDGWIARFEHFPLVQLIDLDAAKSEGANDGLIRRITGRLRCQVGGGVRCVARALALLDAGAARVIVGSALFDDSGVVVARAEAFSTAVGMEQFVAAVDSRGGQVVTHGWRRRTAVTPVTAVEALDPYAGAFLATVVEREGLMKGLDFDAAMAIRRATRRQVIVAGGIADASEVDRLHVHGIDAVVGMAIYTGRMSCAASGVSRGAEPPAERPDR